MLLPILYSKLDFGQGVVGLLGGNKALKRFWPTANLVRDGSAAVPIRRRLESRRAGKHYGFRGPSKVGTRPRHRCVCSCYTYSPHDHRTSLGGPPGIRKRVSG